MVQELNVQSVHYISFQSFAFGTADILVFVVTRQHPPEPNSAAVKTEAARSFETWEQKYAPTLRNKSEGYHLCLCIIQLNCGPEMLTQTYKWSPSL